MLCLHRPHTVFRINHNIRHKDLDQVDYMCDFTFYSFFFFFLHRCSLFFFSLSLSLSFSLAPCLPHPLFHILGNRKRLLIRSSRSPPSERLKSGTSVEHHVATARVLATFESVHPGLSLESGGAKRHPPSCGSLLAS